MPLRGSTTGEMRCTLAWREPSSDCASTRAGWPTNRPVNWRSGTNTRATIESKSTISNSFAWVSTWSPMLTSRSVTMPEIGAETVA